VFDKQHYLGTQILTGPTLSTHLRDSISLNSRVLVRLAGLSALVSVDNVSLITHLFASNIFQRTVYPINYNKSVTDFSYALNNNPHFKREPSQNILNCEKRANKSSKV
jgi:hypothetical protein